MRLDLIRRVYLDTATLGTLHVGTLQLCTLELPWEGNHRETSCIPLGLYKLAWYDSPTHGAVLRVLDVPERDDIELHVANIPQQLKGCIGVGFSWDGDFDQPMIVQSARAMSQLRGLRMQGAPTELLIMNYKGGEL